MSKLAAVPGMTQIPKLQDRVVCAVSTTAGLFIGDKKPFTILARRQLKDLLS